MVGKDEGRVLAILAHIFGIFIGFLGSLVILIASEDKSVKKHARNALNWQLSLIVYLVISAILALILIGFLLMIILGVLNVIFCIIAAIKASEGKKWEYPLTIKFLKN